MQKINNIHWVDPEISVSQIDRKIGRQTDRQTDRQIDGLINRSDFIGSLLQR